MTVSVAVVEQGFVGRRHACLKYHASRPAGGYGTLILKVPTRILAVSSSACMGGPVA